MSLAWVAQQIRTIREASDALPPSLIRFNPRPAGVIRDGSATEEVLRFLRHNPKRFYCHHEIQSGTSRTKVSIDWALIYLRQQALIECVSDSYRNPRFLRYRIKELT